MRIEGDVSSVSSLRNDEGSEEDLLSSKEAYRLFDEQARAILGMSGEDLARRWGAGEYRDLDDSALHSEIIGLMMLRPCGRTKRA